MKRRIVSSLRSIQSLSASSPSRLPYNYQASHYLAHLFSASFSLSRCSSSCFLNTQQNLYFSSGSPHIVRTNEWSQSLENELLEKLHSTPLTHEAVVYVLKNLDKTPNKALDFFNWACDKHGFKPNSIVCNLMLRILSSDNESLKEFKDLVLKMREEGFDIEQRTYTHVIDKFISCNISWRQYLDKMPQESGKDASVVRGLADVILQSDWNDNVKKKIEIMKGHLTEKTVMRIFTALRVDPLKALFFFLWLRESAGYTHNAVTYNGILRIICKKELVEEFWCVVKEMKGAGFDMDLDTYALISKQFQVKKMAEDSVQLYEVMMVGAYKPPVQHCANLLSYLGYNNTPDMDLVARVVRIHEAAGYALYKDVYDVVYKCLASAGRFGEADKILDAMRNAGFQPDKATYEYALFALGKAGKLEEAIRMLNEMEEKGYVPDVTTWTHLIQGQCRGSEIDQALKSCAMLLERNLKANAEILDALVGGLCTKGRVDCAYSLLTGAVSKANIKPFTCTYITLIQYVLRDKKFEKGTNLLLLMKECKLQRIINPFANYISKFGTVENAVKFLEALREPQFVPACNRVLHAFLKEGRESEAQGFLQACPHHIRKHASISNIFASLKPKNAPI